MVGKFGPPIGSSPGYRRPVLIIQSERFNRSRINTVIVAAITTNISLAEAPGNVLLAARTSRLSRDSVVNVSQIATLDKSDLSDYVHTLPAGIMAKVDNGLRSVLAL